MSSKKGKGKGKGGGVSLEPYTVEVKEALTAVYLLDSSQDDILFMSLCSIDNLITRGGPTLLNALQQAKILQRLLNVLSKSPANMPMCLKLIVKVTTVEGTIEYLQKKDNIVELFVQIFMTTNAPVILEHVTYLLSHICTDPDCASSLCDSLIIKQLFITSVKIMDLDIRANTLLILLRLVTHKEIGQMVFDSGELNIKVLNLVLQGPFIYVRPIVLKIFYYLSSWNIEKLHDEFYNSETILYLLDIVSEPQWTDFHNQCLTIIYNCLKWHPFQTNTIESKKFMTFLNFARTASKEHAFACITLISELLKNDENRKVLILFYTYKLLPEFCSVDCDLTLARLYNVIGEFCKHFYVAEDLVSEDVIKEISLFANKKNLPWNPYRQSGIFPLHGFLIANSNLGILFFRYNLFKLISEALLNSKEVEEFYYIMALQILQILLTNKCFHNYLWTEELYLQIVSLLKHRSIVIVTTALVILQSSMYQKKYRQWFVEMNGLETIVSLTASQNCDTLDKLIIFLKCITKHCDLCTIILRHGLIPVLTDIAGSSIARKGLCENLIEEIYKCELSIKFYITKKLDCSDITQNGFCVYIGPPPRNFPPEEIIRVDQLSSSCTIITVNFHGKKKLKLPYITLEQNNLPELPSEENIEKTTNENMLKTKVICKYSLPIPDKDPHTDYYLKSYLKKLKKTLVDKENVVEKLQIIAKFIAACMNGYDKSLLTKHQYETHINELKKKMQSNYIPLGYIRIGQMIEKAVLFKVLADRLNIPSSLHRTDNYIAWNEIPIYSDIQICTSTSNIYPNHVQKYVLDLIENIGALLPKGHRNAMLYCTEPQTYITSYGKLEEEANISMKSSISETDDY